MLSVCLYSPGSQQGGVPPSGGPVAHLGPGELGASQPTKRPRPGLQAAVDREPVRQGTGQHHHCLGATCQSTGSFLEPLNQLVVCVCVKCICTSLGCTVR